MFNMCVGNKTVNVVAVWMGVMMGLILIPGLWGYANQVDGIVKGDFVQGQSAPGGGEGLKKFGIGARVRAIVDNPDGNPCIVIGSTGTIVCTDTVYFSYDWLVEWDDMHCGHYGHGACSLDLGDSGWFVIESQIETIWEPNDACEAAYPVELDQAITGTTNNAKGTDVSSCAYEDFADVWFTFTAPSNGTYDVSLCGSDFDTTLSVFEGACGAMSEIACNDDACGLNSELLLVLNSGITYYIRVAGYGGYTGNYLLNVTDCPGDIAVTDTLAPNDDQDIAYGDLAVGGSQVEQVTVTNTNGSCALEVASVSLNGMGAKVSSPKTPRPEASTNMDSRTIVPVAPAVVSSYNAPKALYNAAIFQDYDPWGSTRNQDILAANGISYTIYGTADMGVVDLSGFDKVIVASIQSAAFNAALGANRAWFEAYVSAGGLLDLHLADWNPHAAVLPGGFSYTEQEQNDLTIADAENSLFNWPNGISDSDLDGWSASTHGYFSAYPPCAHTLVTYPGGQPCVMEVPLGEGRILATCQTVEFSGASYGYLENMNLCDLTPFWVKNQPAFPKLLGPGESFTLDVYFTPKRSGDFEATLEITSADADEPVIGVALSGFAHLFEIGARVVAIVDHPDGSDCIVTGSTGTIVCQYMGQWLVEWDDMHCGHNGNGYCDVDLGDSGWYVYESQIEVICEEDPVHPADLNSDWRMQMGEAIGYLSGWQHGANPMSYAIRAAYLWQNGEYYMYDDAFSPPLCWVLTTTK